MPNLDSLTVLHGQTPMMRIARTNTVLVSDLESLGRSVDNLGDVPAEPRFTFSGASGVNLAYDDRGVTRVPDDISTIIPFVQDTGISPLLDLTTADAHVLTNGNSIHSIAIE